MRSTSFTAVWIELAASSMFLISPFLIPFYSAQLTAMIDTSLLALSSAIAAHIFVEPISIPKILADTICLSIYNTSQFYIS